MFQFFNKSDKSKLLEQRSKEYAERELLRFHTVFSIYYVHPRAQWIFLFAITVVPLFALFLMVFFCVIVGTMFDQFIDLEQLCKDSYIVSYITMFLIFMLFILCFYVANWISAPIYFLGYYFKCISFDEMLALIKDPFTQNRIESLFWTYVVSTITPQFTLEQASDCSQDVPSLEDSESNTLTDEN